MKESRHRWLTKGLKYSKILLFYFLLFLLLYRVIKLPLLTLPCIVNLVLYTILMTSKNTRSVKRWSIVLLLLFPLYLILDAFLGQPGHKLLPIYSLSLLFTLSLLFGYLMIRKYTSLLRLPHGKLYLSIGLILLNLIFVLGSNYVITLRFHSMISTIQTTTEQFLAESNQLYPLNAISPEQEQMNKVETLSTSLESSINSLCSLLDEYSILLGTSNSNTEKLRTLYHDTLFSIDTSMNNNYTLSLRKYQCQLSDIYTIIQTQLQDGTRPNKIISTLIMNYNL